MKEPKTQYGFVEPTITEDNYVFGGFFSLPKIILQEEGSWVSHLPKYEPQFNQNFDSYGCTVWGTQNAIETLEKRLTGIERNYSERYNYISCGINPPGTDPHKVAENIRSIGMVDDSVLPFTTSYEEFLTPDPLTPNLLQQGKKWKDKWTFKHEWVFKNVNDINTKRELMKENLRFSPLGISVSAWHEKDGVYHDLGLPNNHWCLLVTYDGDSPVVFDSYDQSIKTLSPEHNIMYCKRYLLTPNLNKPDNWLVDLIRRLTS